MTRDHCLGGYLMVHPRGKICPEWSKDREGNDQWHKEAIEIDVEYYDVPEHVKEWFIEVALEKEEDDKQKAWEEEQDDDQ